MKLHYFNAVPNFGDALNPWLWPQLLGHRLDDDASRLFLGIGTILRADVPAARAYHVLGSGGGYGPYPKIDERWRFYAVRGPLTAQALGLPAETVATDAAALLSTIELPAPRPGLAVGFMPHFQAMHRIPWRALCQRLGLRYLDPRGPVEELLAEIRGCRCIFAEAMHAAIVADTCRVPWVRVTTGGHVLDSKWEDWLTPLELTAPVYRLAHFARVTQHRPGDSRLWAALRQTANAAVFTPELLRLAANLARLRHRFDRGRLPLVLSRDTVLRVRTERLLRALDQLRDEHDRVE